MHYFEQFGKINYVDNNNVIVGYDISHQCCESFDHFLAFDEHAEENDFLIDLELDDYNFDTSYFKETGDNDEYMDGSRVSFLLTAEGCPDIYLILTNYHNGYYSHGFEMTREKEVIHEGCI